ncbi:hypothetical protein NicSoilB4_32000 [Arthrobacter sp. NicSoilB4]|nr:hypothetical protein NicSoilB4_32000 [Arthrobacter sp. NicSoilB4]
MHSPLNAERRFATRTKLTLPATRTPRQHDLVPWLDGADSRTDFFDDAGAFMAKHDRGPACEVAVRVMQIAVAHAGRLDPHPHLARAWGGKSKFHHAQRLIGGMHYRSFHRDSFIVGTRQDSGCDPRHSGLSPKLWAGRP